MSQDKPVLSPGRQHAEAIWQLSANVVLRLERDHPELRGKILVADIYTPLCLSPLLEFKPPPHNDHEPPPFDMMAELKKRMEDGPASGSPDTQKLVEQATRLLEMERLPLNALHANGEIINLYEWAKGLRALETDRERILAAHKAVMRNADEYAESLQHQLTQRNEWLREALDRCDALGKELAAEHDKLWVPEINGKWSAQIRKEAFGE